MKIFYRLFIFLYPKIAWLINGTNAKARMWLQGRKNIFERLAVAFRDNTSSIIWVHCSSLGEFEQGRPLIESFKKKYPDYKILLTFFSPSGYEVRKKYENADWIFYLPMDSNRHAQIFYDIVQPSLVIFIKYEFWFYYLKEAEKRNIPLLLISGIFRKSQPFFHWYGNFHRQMLHCFTHLFVQNETSKELLKNIGFSQNVTISGDTRFDRVIEIAGQFQSMPVIERFIGNSDVIVAGSTWTEDDEELDHFANTHPGIKFIIAPHEIETERIKQCLSYYKHSVLYSSFVPVAENSGIPVSAINHTADALSKPESIGKPSVDTGNSEETGTAVNLLTNDNLIINSEKEKITTIIPNVLIIDNIGMLSQLYHYATICYVGGAFGDEGVHNVLEAAVYNKPVVFGPVYDKYAEAVELINTGGGFSVENALELENLLDQLLQKQDHHLRSSQLAGDYVKQKAGATQNILQYIQENRLLTN